MLLKSTPQLIFSCLATDPDVGELVDLFVSEIPARTAQLRDCRQNGDWEGLRRYAHQLKGAMGSYGFYQLTPALQQLELAAKECRSEPEIESSLQAVLELSSLIRAGSPSVD